MKKDIAIIGGGLAGLTAAIITRRMGHSVILIEKKAYPFHKVCGEYISLEAENILRWLGLPVEEWQLPILSEFRITHPHAKTFNARLPLGGLGISRFTLDQFLKDMAEKEGVAVLEQTKVNALELINTEYNIETDHANFPKINASVVLGAFGRNKPHFATSIAENHINSKGFVGVKMHVRADLPKNRIELHHFSGGYCGISAIENNAYCLCYLIDGVLVKDQKGDFQKVEENILSQNLILKGYLTQFEKITNRVSTAGVFFSPRPLSKNGMLFLGDSAGMIPPLAGNGMGMAIHSAVLASEISNQFLKGMISRQDVSILYEMEWKKLFETRLTSARMLQNIMQTNLATMLSMKVFSLFPGIFQIVAKKTHGKQIPIPNL